ncbi:MAG TPA: cytochrome P450 [Burkholderiaceae bacterium]|nr:cytochrome P450 [Burkholderiaceae bacterium]
MDATPLTATPRRIEDLPSPWSLPLLGNLHQVRPLRMHQVLEQWAGQLGSPYSFRILNKRMTVWTDVEVMHSVLRDRPQRFRRHKPIESVLTELGGNGLFSAEGTAWQPQRRMIMQALATPHFRGFYPTLHAITERLRQRWQRAAERGETIQMTHDLTRYTVDVTSALAFGEDPNTLEQQGDVIQNHLAVIFPMIMSRINAPFPWWRHLRLPRDRRLDRAMVVVHRYVRDTMQRARQRMRDDPSDTPRNLLEAMLRMRDAPGSGVTDDDVAANVLTLLLAGEDTTANSLAWTLPYLAADPALQDRLHAQAAFGAERVCPTYEAVRQLDLFEALATEAGRLRPVAPVMGYEPLEDVRVGDVHVPAGTYMFFLTRPPTLDPAHFAEASRYDPERWLRERNAQAGAHEPRAYLQFGAGPRVCPGRYLAGVEMRLVLSMLMRNFRLRLAVDPAQIREVLAFTLMPSTMPVKLEPRADAG